MESPAPKNSIIVCTGIRVLAIIGLPLQISGLILILVAILFTPFDGLLIVAFVRIRMSRILGFTGCNGLFFQIILGFAVA
jgi:hypothetical protein